jgi:catabolite repression HPr-like protein
VIRKNAMIRLQTGLHARPAALFVQEANKFVSDIYLEKETSRVNAKSIMGIMGLALKKDSEVIITAEGPDDEKAVEALFEFVGRERIEI